MGVIRFILALSVALWHVPGHPLTLVYAAPAVLGFFIISGFYMAMVLTEKYRDNIKAFYIARFWRLYPAYAAMCVVMVLWFVHTHTPTAFTARLPVTNLQQILLAAMNVSLVGQDFFEFSRNAFGDSNFRNALWMLVGQAWSLSSELYFYLLAPFIVRSLPRTAIVLAAALVLRIILLGWLQLPWFWGYWFFPGSMCMFFLGAFAYHVHAHISIRHEVTVAKLLAAALAIWLIYSVSRFGIMLGVDATANVDTFTHWICYLVFAAGVPLIFSWTKNNAFDRGIGELSYPLYLVHGLVQGIFYFRFNIPQGRIWWALVAVSASVFAAIAMRIAIEMPVEAWHRKSSDSPESAKPATV